MNQPDNGAERARKYISILKCPVCGGPFLPINSLSLVCAQGHTFDRAKQGYFNLTTRPAQGHYDKELFAARRRIITGSGLYSPMHETIAQRLANCGDPSVSGGLMVDMGCGEGSHLRSILHGVGRSDGFGLGIDLSKEGIRMAARRDADELWLVADLAQAPLRDQSAQGILNLLSPANYQEFKRILAPEGVLVKVVPGSDYLRELRETLYVGSRRKEYSNANIVSLFRQHFSRMEVVHLKYRQRLEAEELRDLVRMSPLAWSAEPTKIAAFTNRDHAEITVDVNLLLGRNGPLG
ncbi:putative RNA methyltransferase [Paenibacillus phocaensis]|uniref:putative RNA methyltransferase n=1 Tax=Paenibacillus phocaensis TaxID=1776378 RepID=UPI000839C562|nr:methyltransferase domain-containing protein [Paenibacillus phocaensis]